MSTYFKKGKGWRYDFTLHGQRYTKSWFKTKAEAIQVEARKRKELKNPPTTTPTDMAHSALANEYLDHAKRKFAEKTYKYKVYVYQQFLAFAGDKTISEINTQLIESYLRTRPTNINYNRHRKDLWPLFAWGYKRRMIRENLSPFLDRMPEPRFQRQIPTPEEMSKIMLVAGPDRPLLLVIYHTMARIDEILRLRWEDVNFQERTVQL